jgi:CubicO group peptidase (beta-lactamase class C family)
MKNLTKVSLVTVCCFLLILFCGYSLAETGTSPASSVSAAVKASEETPFPTRSVPGLYVNNSPAFSVSYPANWVEKAPDKPGSVFRVTSMEGFPTLGIFVIPTMGALLEYAAGIYSQELTKTSKDVKLLYDKQTQRADGNPAREAEFEWTDIASGIRGKVLFVTTRKGNDWVVTSVIVDSSKGEMDESLKKIAHSLKFKPEGPVPDKEAKTPYRYKIPEQTDDEWQTADASEMKLNKKKLNDLAGKIFNGTYPNIHSILVIKNGRLVFEEYFPGRDWVNFPGRDWVKGDIAFTREDLHGVMSVTKSFTSTLIGIAIDKGMIKGTKESLLTFFPEYKKELCANNKGPITLQDVLSMTAGFDWDETTLNYLDPRNSWRVMLVANDIISYVLSRPLKDQPGSQFVYNTGLTTLLGTIIERKSSLSINEFAQKYLFGPLGITRYELGYLDQDRKVPASGSDLFLRPRDMAKLGYLFLRKGIWKGEQIVSAKWVEEATREQVKTLLPLWLSGYGYQWWLHKSVIDGKTIEGYAAIGWGGQGIFVFPTLDAVIVFTAGNYSQQDTMLIPWSMLNNDILPAIIKPE